MKRFLTVLLAAVMVVFSIPLTVFSDDVDTFPGDVTACEFILSPDKTEITPGETVNYTLSLRPNGKIYGVQAHLALPEGFTLKAGSGKLASGVKQSLGWDSLDVKESGEGKLIVNGFTANKPYDKDSVLKLAEFSCTASGDARSGTPTLEEYYAINGYMNKVTSTVTSPKITVVREADSDAASCTFRITADKTTVNPGDTVNFVLSIIPDGKIYGFQAYLSLPEGFSIAGGEVISGVKELLGWDDIAVSTKKGTLLFSGYTAQNPYSKTNELKVAKFSCTVGENAATGTVGLTDFYAFNDETERLSENLGDFPTITVEDDPSDTTYTVTVPENVVVTRNGTKLKNGDVVRKNDKLRIEAVAPEGKKLASLTVNGKAFNSGDTYTVDSDNVLIEVSFADIDDTEDPKTGVPFLAADPDIRGWDAICDLLSVETDATIMINMNGTTVLPMKALFLLQTTGNKVQLKMNGAVSWSVSGKDIRDIKSDVDLKVTLNTGNIPETLINAAAQGRDYLTFTLAHNGDLGFKAMLIISVGEMYEKASLYWYNNNALKPEGSFNVLYGLAVMEMTHASDWLIALDRAPGSSGSGSDDPGTSAPGTSKPGTSDPGTSKPGSSDPGTSTPPDALPGDQRPSGSDNKPTVSDPDNNSKDKDKNPPPNTGVRTSLATFLALIASAAACLFSRKQKQ